MTTRTTTTSDTPIDVYDENRMAAGLRLVYAIAAKLYKKINGAIEYDELVSFGTIGLMQAAERYDEDSGAAFTTYAYYRIHGEMVDGVRALAPLPRSAWRRHCARTAVVEQDERREEPEPATPGAEEPRPCGVPVYPVGRRRLSIAVEPTADTDLAHKQAEQILDEAMTELTERESFLIRSHYYDERRLKDAGRDLEVSKSWSSRLHDRALSKLRDRLRDYSYETLAA